VREGDFVVCVADPWSYGNLLVTEVLPDKRIRAQSSDGAEYIFAPVELELEGAWAEGQSTGAMAMWAAGWGEAA
jgi:hypothetical protein